jgi:hypothetical protein
MGKKETSKKNKIFKKMAKDHGVSEAAVETLYDSLIRGGGTMAQFSHPELGGSGQWMNSGMIMIGDMFNNALKARVDALCRALLPEMEFPTASAGISTVFSAAISWWPAEYSSPASTGGQNDFRYAYFPQDNALVVEHAGEIAVYDTTGHSITGFSQQQSSFAGFHFASSTGQKAAAKLPLKAGKKSKKKR